MPVAKRRVWGPNRLLLARGDFEGSRNILEKAGNELPDCRLGAPLLRLRSGKRLPRWNGEHVKHLAAMFPAGYGDTICLGRYLSGLRTRADSVSAIISRRLIPIVARALPSVECVPVDDCSAALNAASAYVDELALPGLSGEGFGIAKWIHADPKRAEKWRSAGCRARHRRKDRSGKQ